MNRLLDILLPRLRMYAALRDLLETLSRIENRTEAIMATMEELQAAIARNHDAENSVIELLNGISAQLKAIQEGGGNQTEQLAAIISEIDASTERLAQAVVQNT